MSFGECIRKARLAQGISIRSLAAETGTNPQVLLSIEAELEAPSPTLASRLRKVLDIPTQTEYSPPPVSLLLPSTQTGYGRMNRDHQEVLGEIHAWLERYLEAERYFPDSACPPFTMPAAWPCRVSTMAEVERAAISLRCSWGLGLVPIENLAEALENHGIRVGLLDGGEDFDAFTTWLNGTAPVIAVRRELSGDCQRFLMARELARLVLLPAGRLKEPVFAERFARAFLVPEPMAFFELVREEKAADLYHLHLLKQKYGLSMQQWLKRGEELQIIPPWSYTRLFHRFHQNRWDICEPGNPIPPEQPRRMQRLVVRALRTGLISRSRAEKLLSIPEELAWLNFTVETNAALVDLTA